MKFYFTYGTEHGFPFEGGWTEVAAESYNLAIAGFTAFHPNRDNSGIINCAEIYSEQSWADAKMTEQSRNLGHYCREKITVSSAAEAYDMTGGKKVIMKILRMVREVLDDG